MPRLFSTQTVHCWCWRFYNSFNCQKGILWAWFGFLDCLAVHVCCDDEPFFALLKCICFVLAMVVWGSNMGENLLSGHNTRILNFDTILILNKHYLHILIPCPANTDGPGLSKRARLGRDDVQSQPHWALLNVLVRPRVSNCCDMVIFSAWSD